MAGALAHALAGVGRPALERALAQPIKPVGMIGEGGPDYWRRLAGILNDRSGVVSIDPADDVESGYPLGMIGAVPLKPAMRAKPKGSGRSSFDLDYFGQPVRILQNPSPAQLKGFLGRTKWKAARRIKDPETGDEFYWDADAPALHKMVADQLGVQQKPGTIFDVIGID